jgi:hypothetical protein
MKHFAEGHEMMNLWSLQGKLENSQLNVGSHFIRYYILRAFDRSILEGNRLFLDKNASLYGLNAGRFALRTSKARKNQV